MVETVLTPVSAVQAGTDITSSLVTPAAGGNDWVNDGTMFLVIVTVTNPCVITVTGQALAYNGLAVNQASLSVTAGNTAYMGPFPRMYFNDANALCHITSSETSTTKIAVVSCVMKG